MKSMRAAYKQDDGVSYHARDMAVVRGQIEKAAVVLASATPSIETRVNAEQGRYRHLLLNRAMRDAPCRRSRRSICAARRRRAANGFHRALRMPLKRISRGANESLLFLNRRGLCAFDSVPVLRTSLSMSELHRLACRSSLSAARWSAIIAAISSGGPINARNAKRLIR